MYVLLTSLLSPAKPRDKTYAEITAVLKHILGPSWLQLLSNFIFTDGYKEQMKL